MWYSVRQVNQENNPHALLFCAPGSDYSSMSLVGAAMVWSLSVAVKLLPIASKDLRLGQTASLPRRAGPDIGARVAL